MVSGKINGNFLRYLLTNDQLIGKLPFLELVHIEQSEGLEAKILGKLEYFNPAVHKATTGPEI